MAPNRKSKGNNPPGSREQDGAPSENATPGASSSKVVLFPHNFSLNALESGSASVGEPSANSDLPARKEALLPRARKRRAARLKRRGTLKRLLTRRSRKKDLESFLRDRFKQMVLSDLMQRKAGAALAETVPAEAEAPKEAVNLGIKSQRTFKRNPAPKKRTYNNSGGSKYRSSLQRDAVRKARKAAQDQAPEPGKKKPKG